MSSAPLRVAILTGASRGIGLAMSNRLQQEGYLVISAQRTAPEGASPPGKPCTSRFVFVDLSDARSVDAFAADMLHSLPHLDLLVNNAAVCMRGPDAESSRAWQRTMQTNVAAPARLTAAFIPLLARSPRPRIVNVSSGDGQLLFFSDMASSTLRRLHSAADIPTLERGVQKLREAIQTAPDDHVALDQRAYRLSKAALNALTVVTSRLRISRCTSPSERTTSVSAVAVCPGDVDTAMADDGTDCVSPEEAVRNMWQAIEGNADTVNGQFLRYGLPIDW